MLFCVKIFIMVVSYLFLRNFFHFSILNVSENKLPEVIKLHSGLSAQALP